jgi:hypothetical protein
MQQLPVDKFGVSVQPVRVSQTGAPIYLYLDRARNAYRYVLKQDDGAGHLRVVFVDEFGVPIEQGDPSIGLGFLAGFAGAAIGGPIVALAFGVGGFLLGSIFGQAEKGRKLK